MAMIPRGLFKPSAGPVLGLSDLTRQSGRFWAPWAPWNDVLAVYPPVDQVATGRFREQGLRFVFAVDAHAPTVRYLGPDARACDLDGDTVRLPPEQETARPWQVVVDFAARTVLTLDRWETDDGPCRVHSVVSLDGDGWGSGAVGLVLERELLNGNVPHAVGLAAPAEWYGRTLTVDTDSIPALPSGAARTIGEALALRGGVVTAVCDDRIMALCEHSGAAVSGDQAGILYRHIGITVDGLDVGIDPETVSVLA